MKASEANLISWKLVIDSDNRLVTELSCFPPEEIHRFQEADRLVILNAIKEAKTALEPLHKKIEMQLDAVF
mgnify:FL=1|jgi:hypothetical protein|tara:strand:- start:184 stop:396 length:213 start_codon:yes stop_codon:yes gene_type:complete